MSGSILDAAVERRPFGEHDGRSGSALERVVLADGTRLVVKRSSPATDLGARLTHDSSGREWRLWSTGVLDRLPAGVGHAIVDAWREGDETVVVMSDLSDGVVGWDRRLSRSDCRRLLAAAAAMHDAFRGDAIAALCPLDVRLTLLSPRRVTPFAGGANPLPALVLRGWERFANLVPRITAGQVMGLLDDPSPLVARLARHEHTLIHGDLWLVNLAFQPGQVVLLDWGLATWAPPAVEFASFLAGNASQIDASHEEIIEDFEAAAGHWADDDAVRLGLVAGLLELGWNKALDATEHPDSGKRAEERAALDWWLTAAVPGLKQL